MPTTYAIDPRNPSRATMLDHGYIELIQHMGSDAMIDASARVSTGSRPTVEKVARLIDQLMRDGHTGPFEHTALTFQVRGPICVRDEWMRHRTQSYSAESTRWKPFKAVAYMPDVEDIGLQPPRGGVPSGRVYADESSYYDGAGNDKREMAQEALQFAYDYAFSEYEKMLKLGIAREVARLVLPLGTWTEWRATVDLWNLMGFLRLRSAPNALHEIRLYAEAIRAIVTPLFPLSMAGFERYVLGLDTGGPLGVDSTEGDDPGAVSVHKTA